MSMRSNETENVVLPTLRACKIGNFIPPFLYKKYLIFTISVLNVHQFKNVDVGEFRTKGRPNSLLRNSHQNPFTSMSPLKQYSKMPEENVVSRTINAKHSVNINSKR